MGMAASQARYLGLTARKSNVEYEGQQINQQRVALANQSANLFNQLMGMSVPIPPSPSEYSTTQYSFTDGVDTYTLTDMTRLNPPVGGNNYNVTYEHMTEVYQGARKNWLGVPVSVSAGTYWVNGSKCSAYVAAEDQDAVSTIANTPATSGLRVATDYPGATGDILKFTMGSSSHTYYVSQAELVTLLNGGTSVTGNVTTAIAEYSSQPVTQTENAYIENNETGRLTDITLSSTGQEYPLHAETTTDDLAYEDAMNQYAYDINVYEKQVQDINAKTEIIQQEDRTLELRLKQLDTEQEALQTEMDAVKKVIDKNIEQTFKTFA